MILDRKLQIAFDIFRIKNSTSSTFSWTINNPYDPKKNYEVFEVIWAITAMTTKTWLAKVAAIFTNRTSLLHTISFLGLFYSKTKKFYFSFHSSFTVLIFTFDMHVRITYFFHIIKNNGNNIRCTTEGEKSDVKWGIIPYYFFV